MTNNSINKSPRQNGFTIVELLVALALVLFIMSIISQVFVDASEAFRSARSKAELTEKLRFITQTLRADLRSRHFENGRKLSDSDFWKIGPPKAGYFRLEQVNFPTTISTVSGDNFPVGTPSDGNLLAFTSFLDGQNPGSFHSINANFNLSNWLTSGGFSPRDTRFEDAKTFNSPDAEVAWFLAPGAAGFSSEYPMQDEAASPVSTIKVFSLIRRVWPLAPEKQKMPSNALTLNDGISVTPSGFNGGQWASLEPNTDVPTRRALGMAYPSGLIPSSWRTTFFDGNIAGVSAPANVIANNVLSFTIEVLQENASQFIPLRNLQYFDSGTNSFQSASTSIFDTWSSRPNDGSSVTGHYDLWNIPTAPDCVPMLPSVATQGSLPPRITAIRVTIRLYDTNNALSPSKTTWQATLVEPL